MLIMLSIFSPNVYRRGSVSARNHGFFCEKGVLQNQSKRTSLDATFLAKGPCCEATALASIQLVALSHWSQKNGHLLLVMVIVHKGLNYLSKVGDVSCVEICTIHMEVTGVIGLSQNHRSHG